MKWIDIKDKAPECGEEVLVLVDGHRGPAWRNNYALVAYMGLDGKWYEERHHGEPIEAVIKWAEIEYP